MSEIRGVHCFLCHKSNSSIKGYKSIDITVCTASNKKVKDVLNYLARCAKSIIPAVPRDQWICTQCMLQLNEYDAIMLSVLRKQRKLVELVEKASLSLSADVLDECNSYMATMEKDEFDEDVEISENEIAETVREAFGDRRVDDTALGRENRILIPCNFCAMKFRSKTRLHHHVSYAHKKFCCELCSYSHRNEDYVKLHMNIHEGRNENQCRFCEKEFSTKLSTIRHMEVHFDTKKYQCDKCGLCFSQTTVLYNHKLQHEAEEQPLQCEICAQIFKTKRTYRHHMITHRADRPRHNCEFCSKTFTEKYTLKVHRRTHPEANQMPVLEVTDDNVPADSPALGSKESRFNCIICQCCFANKDQLNKHMEKEHDVILKSLTLSNYSQYEVVTNESKKSCNICGHMFSTQANLDNHLENMHGVLFK